MRIIAAILSLGLCGCASAPNLEPLEWSSLGTDCYDRGLSEVLLFPDSSGTMLSRTDIRIGRLPDSGNGPGLVAHFRQGLNGPFGQSVNPNSSWPLVIGGRAARFLSSMSIALKLPESMTNLKLRAFQLGMLLMIR